MQERYEALTTDDGTMETFIVHPDIEPGNPGPWPVVLFLMDAPGMREEIRDMSRRLATAGYYVMTSQLYYRDVQHYNVFETGDRDRMFELMGNLSNGMVDRDCGAMIGLAAGDDAADAERVGVVGYCMSGPFAVTAAAAHPEVVKAAASIHGVALVTDGDDSPHRHLDKVTAEVYLACAETDSYAPPEMIDAFEAAMNDIGTRGRVEWYPGTEHGFAYRERPAYDKAASERHWERLHHLFASNLRP